MPQMTASTARRSIVRRARSPDERFCACPDATAQIKASAARAARFIVLLLTEVIARRLSLARMLTNKMPGVGCGGRQSTLGKPGGYGLDRLSHRRVLQSTGKPPDNS